MATRELIGNAARGGDLAWIRLEVERGRIVSARGEGDGAGELCEAVRGLSPLEAAAVPGPALALDALHDALAPAVRARPDPARVAVAMSGGVDSAVALLEARAGGRKAVGVTLRLWTDPVGPDGERACCSPAAVIAARETCHALGVPHVTLDLRERFREAVVAPFVAGYEAGETPNPCVRCNGSFRFGELLAFARRVGAARLATGHYARLREHRGRLLLARAADAAKDQSYMLARLDPRRLERLWFPLGEWTKEETRARARAAGLAAAARAESQEACFLAGGDYREFLARHGVAAEEGPIVDGDGRELGRHAGFWRFTPWPAQGHRRLGRRPALRPRHERRDEHGRRRPARGARPDVGRRPLGPPLRAGRPCAGKAPLPLARFPRERQGLGARLSPLSRRAGLWNRAGAGGRALRGRRRRRSRPDLRSRLSSEL